MLKHTWRSSETKTDVRLTGEPDDRETVTSGSEGGGWKSAHTLRVQGNSLAAYPTVVAPVISPLGSESSGLWPSGGSLRGAKPPSDRRDVFLGGYSRESGNGPQTDPPANGVEALAGFSRLKAPFQLLI